MSNLVTMMSDKIELCSSSGEIKFSTNNQYLYENTLSPFWFPQAGSTINMDIDSQIFTGVGGGGRFNIKVNINNIYTSTTYGIYSYNSVWYDNDYNKNNDSTGVVCTYTKLGVL